MTLSQTEMLRRRKLQHLERTIRRQVLDIEDRPTQDALFSLLALVIEVRQRTDAQA